MYSESSVSSVTRSFTREKKFKCPRCCQVFATNGQMKRHLIKKNPCLIVNNLAEKCPDLPDLPDLPDFNEESSIKTIHSMWLKLQLRIKVLEDENKELEGENKEFKTTICRVQQMCRHVRLYSTESSTIHESSSDYSSIVLSQNDMTGLDKMLKIADDVEHKPLPAQLPSLADLTTMMKYNSMTDEPVSGMTDEYVSGSAPDPRDHDDAAAAGASVPAPDTYSLKEMMELDKMLKIGQC